MLTIIRQDCVAGGNALGITLGSYLGGRGKNILSKERLTTFNVPDFSLFACYTVNSPN